jgi:hypothetical protein
MFVTHDFSWEEHAYALLQKYYPAGKLVPGSRRVLTLMSPRLLQSTRYIHAVCSRAGVGRTVSANIRDDIQHVRTGEHFRRPA